MIFPSWIIPIWLKICYLSHHHQKTKNPNSPSFPAGPSFLFDPFYAQTPMVTVPTFLIPSHQTSVPSHRIETTLMDAINSTSCEHQQHFTCSSFKLSLKSLLHPAGQAYPLSLPTFHFSLLGHSVPATSASSLNMLFPQALYLPFPLFEMFCLQVSTGLFPHFPQVSIYSQTTSYNSLSPSPYFVFCQSLYQFRCMLM